MLKYVLSAHNVLCSYEVLSGAPLNMRTPDGSNYSVTYGYNSQGMPVRIIENPNNRGVTSYNDNVRL